MINKKWIIVAGAAVLLCVACLLISYLGPGLSSRASNFGVTEKGKSALVIRNKSSAFYILDVAIEGDASQKWDHLIGKGSERVYSIDPGAYTVRIHYSDKTDLSNLGFMTWYVSAYKNAEFEVTKGRTVVYKLEGGSTMGMMYDPPDLMRE